MEDDRNKLLEVIGPGLVLAGSAIGVSHLVQSTRAGAMYGLALLGFILVSMLAKYPAFLFGPRYAAATGRSLLSGYRQQGWFAIGFFTFSTLSTVFVACAANLLITSGLVKVALGLDLGIFPIAVICSAAGMALLVIGHYRWLDWVIKVLVIFLTLCTIVATFISWPMIDFSVSGRLFPEHFDIATILFIAALVGWMPTPMDVPVWHSQWSVAKMRDTGKRPSLRQASIDFNIGYVMILVLALCFLVLGTAVMHGSGQEFSGNPTEFAAQVIGLYEESLGAWSGMVVGLAALAAMFSTYLTILDGFPRVLANLALIYMGAEEAVDEDAETDDRRHRYYWIIMAVMVIGALTITTFFLNGLSRLIDFAATVSFLGGPVFAYLNHRAIHGPEVPAQAHPGRGLRLWSQCGVFALTAFALLYIYFAFIN